MDDKGEFTTMKASGNALRGDLSIAELARLLNVHPYTLQRHAREGRLKGAYRLGRVWRVTSEGVAALRGGAA